MMNNTFVRKRLTAMLMVAALLLLMAVPSFGQDTEINFGLSFTVDTLDPGVTTFSGVEIIVGHVFDTLVKQEPLGAFSPKSRN